MVFAAHEDVEDVDDLVDRADRADRAVDDELPATLLPGLDLNCFVGGLTAPLSLKTLTIS